MFNVTKNIYIMNERNEKEKRQKKMIFWWVRLKQMLEERK